MKTLIEIMTEIISKQINHNNSLTPEFCYEEITNVLNEKKFKGFTVCERVGNPDCIIKSDNFQYISDAQNKKVQIVNKFFN